MRDLNDLTNRRSGWESAQLATGTISLPTAKYSDAEKITAFHRLTLERLASLPGVASASISTFAPFFNWPDTRKFFVEGRERPQRGHEPAAVVNNVSPQYFEAFNTRVLSGRAFNERDTATSTKVFIISQATARGLFDEENPIGRRLAQADGQNLRWGEVIGVVRDVQSVVPDPGPVTYQVYQPMAQEPGGQNEIAVRTTGVAPSSIVESIRTTMAALDPDLPVRKLQPADATIERANYQSAVLRDMLIAFGVLGGSASLRLASTASSRRRIRHSPRLGRPYRKHHPDGPRLRGETGAARIGRRSARCAWRYPNPCSRSPQHAHPQPSGIDRHNAPAHRHCVGRLLDSCAPRQPGRCHVAITRRVTQTLT